MFISHEWVDPMGHGPHGHPHPDPNCHQLRAMQFSVGAIVKKRGWDPDDAAVWCDYLSIPQANRSCQRLAIDAIVDYAPGAHAFVAVAPRVERPRPCLAAANGARKEPKNFDLASMRTEVADR